MVTPAFALECLKYLHPNQRNEKPREIGQLVRKLKNGKWEHTHQGAAFDEDGCLVDGRNRFTAIVKANVCAPIWICYNVPRKGMKHVDCGVGRTTRDAAQMEGIDVRKELIAVANRMYLGLSIRGDYTNDEKLDIIKFYYPALEYVQKQFPHNIKGVTTSGMKAVIARAWYTVQDRDRLTAFCKAMISGEVENNDEDRAVIMLRNWFLTGTIKIGESGSGFGGEFQVSIYKRTEYALAYFLRKTYPSGGIKETIKEKFPLPPLKKEEEVLA
jgi:hypothetical protein